MFSSLFSVTDDDEDNKRQHQNFQIVQEPKKVFSNLDVKANQKEIPRQDDENEDSEDPNSIDLPEPHRRADNNPLILSVEKASNDDIYFIGMNIINLLFIIMIIE